MINSALLPPSLSAKRKTAISYISVDMERNFYTGRRDRQEINDTRESAAIYVTDKLMDEQAQIHVYDPKVNYNRMLEDMSGLRTWVEEKNRELLKFETNPYEAVKDAHAVAVLTELDEFTTYDWQRIYNSIKKPAFVFDGRNILDHKMLRGIGFEVSSIGKS